jgi:hypothetical protein
MNSFISGGFIPTKQRGTVYRGLVAAWDWWASNPLRSERDLYEGSSQADRCFVFPRKLNFWVD